MDFFFTLLMTKTILSTIFLATILLLSTILTAADFNPSAEAAKGKGVKLLATGSNKVCGDRLCSEVGGQTVMPSKEKSEEKSEETPKKEQVKTEKKMEEQEKATKPMEEQKMQQEMQSLPPWQTITGTIESVQDPGIGHESHQLAVILAPSEKIYRGQLTYSASEPIQLVALHGPLLPGQDKGQPTWTPDGETKFALTFVDPGKNMGSWAFSGNAIAVHTMNTTPFTTSYSAVAGS